MTSSTISLLIFGASGHAHVLSSMAKLIAGTHFEGFVDRALPTSPNPEILGIEDQLEELIAKHAISHAIVGIGDNFIRKKVVDRVSRDFPSLKWASLIHPKAVIAPEVRIGPGTAVMAGAVINPGTSIGSHCIINTRVSVDHDNRIDDFASLAPGVTTGGHVSIGKNSIVSIGATVRHQIHIGQNSLVGAGSLVLNDIPEGVLAYGVPAKIIRSRKEGEKYL
jgi:sugar O-acyltransferase (sialic acid O-acetyltransferase NeuD family)